MEKEKSLANIMKPKNLSEVIGQNHLVGKNKIFNNMIKNKKLFSFILWGKSGSGKNSIADALLNEYGELYRYLNAVINNKKDIDRIFEEAKISGHLIVVVDEFHRLNKDKQDLFLPYIENELITLIILTSENPYHYINPAIRSRMHLFELKSLSEKDIIKALDNVVKKDVLKGLKLDNKTKKLIAKLSSNDLRYAYNLLELAYYYDDSHEVNEELIKKINPKANIYSDKDGENYYDLLSALQKSIRGSDPDASLYYLGRLINQGDIDVIFRRLTVIAYEDISLANPNIALKVDAAYNSYKRVGMPEAKIILASIVTEMALSPKSNSTYLGINEVLSDIEKGHNYDVKDSIKFHTTTYDYPHDHKFSIAKEYYLPNPLKNKKYYKAKEIGYEKKLKKIEDRINEIKNRV